MLVEIHDDGPGIAEGMRERMWELGASTKAESTEHQARGIGLALVHRVVNRRRGTITVADSDLGGAAFTILLPAPVSDPVPATTQPAGRT